LENIVAKLTANKIYSVSAISKNDAGLLSVAFGPNATLQWVDYVVRDGETDDEWRMAGYVPLENGHEFGIDAAISVQDLQCLKANAGISEGTIR
jgi:hypothetical protein